VSNGGRRPQRSTSSTVNGDCTTSRLRNVWRVRQDGGHCDDDRHRHTSLVVGVVWRRKCLRSCEHSAACNRTFARLQKLA